MRKLKRSLLLFFSFILLGLVAFIPKAEDPQDNPQEKVYLHMDKPYYAVGDTIWFKAYVTVGSRHQLSALSGAVYVDLITEKDSIVKSLKLPLTAGMAMGDFTLADEMKEGNYRIRAYTQWMRNAGEEYFFDRTFVVGLPVREGIVTTASYKYDNGNKPVLIADLNYTDDNGSPLSSKNVQYEVFTNRKRAWGKSGTTDDKGNLSVSFTNDQQADLRGAFIRTIIELDGKTKITKDLPIKAGFANTDVQFFPESGNLVNGVTSRVAFKAVGVDGLGVKLKGSITDEQNNEVSTFETLNAGMGSFLLKPESGKNYSAKVSFADGSVKAVPLPKALDDGYVLSVYQPNRDSILVRIYASKTKVNQAAQAPVNVNFIAGSGGETIISTPVKISRASSSFWLEKKSFPSGIAQFTLSNAAGEPLNERIAFIRSNDLMQLNVKTAKVSYKSRERVQVDLEALSGEGKPTAGNFSVTVIDESKVPVEESMESTIFSNLLLTSDLKGYVEKPNYYFTKDTDEVNRALDNLMLTQGYRRFVWKQPTAPITAPTPSKPKFEAEGLGISISGKVITLGGKAVPNATVLMMAAKAGVMKNDTTDINGRFKFDNIFLTDSIGFSIQARLGKNSKLEVVLDSLPKLLLSKNKNIADVVIDVNKGIKDYINSTTKQDQVLAKIGMLNRTQRLNEVVIKAKKLNTNSLSPQGMFKVPEGSADQTFVFDDAANCASFIICLQGRLQGISFRSNGDNINYPFSRNEPMDVFLDGQLLSPEDISNIFDGNSLEPSSIGKIEIVRTNQALINMLNKRPALLIITKRGYIRQTYNPSIANITPKGFNKAREFYAPRYVRSGSSNPLPDLRSTIHWNPAIKTFSTGKTTFDYFNADGPGKYKVIVEGINADGELGRAVYRYQVEQGDPAVMAMLDSGEPSVKTSIPDEDIGVIAIRNALDTARKNLPIEKLYIHTDKPYYSIGDTLWFKGYVLDGSLNPSKQSGLLYVELGDDSAEVVRRISIPIKDGIAWAQIPLDKKIFHEGGYSLRAYTNWMQNFGEDYIFKKRFYLGVPVQNTWLVKSDAKINRVDEKDQLEVELKFKRTDKTAVALRDVEVTIYEDRHYLYKEKMQTSQDGNLKFSKALKDKADGRNIRVEVRNIHPADGRQLLQIPLSVNRNQKIDLQFLPEGGYLVDGLQSRLGFKALAEDGRGIPVSGVILNKAGLEQASFQTTYNGIGSVDFTPQRNEVYTAVLKDIAGNQIAYKLPKTKASGTVIKVTNEEKSPALQINISGTPDVMGADSSFYLIGTSNDKMYYSKKIGGIGNLEINKDVFPTGISKLTLFRGKQPLNERLIYIDHQDQLNVNLISNKASYLKRDSVSLILEVKDKNGMPVKGNFSLAVTDDSQVKADTTGNFSIQASLLLTNALKGQVETPGYYLNRKDPNAWKALDNLLLTQGWTGYSWDNIFKNIVPKFTAEKDFRINGKVVNAFNKPIVGAPVLISSQKPSFITNTITDKDGKFTFTKLPQIDSGSFFFQAQSSKGKTMSFGEVSIDRITFPRIPETFRDPVLPWYVNSDSTQVNYIRRVAEKAGEASLQQTGIALKEVNIQSKKIIKGSFLRSGSGNSDLAFDQKDIKESAVMDLYQFLKQKLPGLRVVYDENVPALLYNDYLTVIGIDGGELQPAYSELETFVGARTEMIVESISQYPVANIIGVEVVYSRKYMQRYIKIDPGKPDTYISSDFRSDQGFLNQRAMGPNKKQRFLAHIEITTRDGKGWHVNTNANSTTYRPLPVMYPQVFYSPKYTSKAPIAEADFRSTLYWAPNIFTDASGRAKVSFYTSDIPGSYTVNVQGTTTAGAIGSANSKIKTK